jgi:hypothetical protein
VNLSVQERFAALAILPAEGNFITLKLVRILRESLSFSADEIKEYAFVEKDGMTEWDPNAAQEKDIDLGEVGADLLAKELKQMDSENRLTDSHFTLYEKIVGGGAAE